MNTSELQSLPRPVVLIAGAGISVRPPAAAPLWTAIAADTIRHLLDILNTGREDWDLPARFGQIALTLRRRPELLFEQIRVAVGTEQIVERLCTLLSRGEPNDCHRSIAELCRQGKIRQIVTTNFDNYLELALDDMQVPYHTIVLPTGAEHASASAEISIFKVHGSIDIPSSIVMTLNRAAQPLSREAATLLRELTADSDLLFTGYSGYDVDVFPVIATAARAARQRHQNVWINDIAQPEQWGPLRALHEEGTALALVGDATILLSRLAGRDAAPLSCGTSEGSSLISEVAPGDVALILGTLFLEAGETSLACEMFHVAEDIADEDDPSRKSAALAGESLCWLEADLSSGFSSEYRAARHFANWSHSESCKVDMRDQRERDFLWISRAAIVRAIVDDPRNPTYGLWYLDQLKFYGGTSSWPWYDIVEAEKRLVRALLLESLGKASECIDECHRGIEFAMTKGLASSELRMRVTLARVLESTHDTRDQVDEQALRIRELHELCGIDADRTLFGRLSNKPLGR